ncbi:hypothetical protein ACLOJK_031229 [Asimina triloba]
MSWLGRWGGSWPLDRAVDVGSEMDDVGCPPPHATAWPLVTAWTRRLQHPASPAAVGEIDATARVPAATESGHCCCGWELDPFRVVEDGFSGQPWLPLVGPKSAVMLAVASSPSRAARRWPCRRLRPPPRRNPHRQPRLPAWGR